MAEVTGDLLPVLAHAWLNHVAAIAGATATLQEFGDRLPAEDRDAMLQAIIRQAGFLQDAVRDVIEL